MTSSATRPDSTAIVESDLSISQIVFGGVVATVVMTVFFSLFGNNWIRSIGSLFITNPENVFLIYAVGLLVHFGIGIAYAFAYARWFLPIRELNYIIKGLVYGTALMVIAYAGFPYLASFSQWTHALMGYGVSAKVEQTKVATKPKVSESKNESQEKPAEKKSSSQFSPLNSVVAETPKTNSKESGQDASESSDNTQSSITTASELSAATGTQSITNIPSESPNTSQSPSDTSMQSTVTSSEQSTTTTPTPSATPNATQSSEANAQSSESAQKKSESSQTDTEQEKEDMIVPKAPLDATVPFEESYSQPEFPAATKPDSQQQSQQPQEAQPKSIQQPKSVIKASLFSTPHDMPIESGIDVDRDILGAWMAHVAYGVTLAIFFHRTRKRHVESVTDNTTRVAS